MEHRRAVTKHAQPGWLTRDLVRAVDSMSAQIAIVSSAGRVLFANAAFRELVRKPRGRLRNISVCTLNLFAGCDKERALNEWLRDFLSGQRRRLNPRYKMMTSTGEKWYRLIGTAVADDRSRFLLTNEDITRVKAAEALAARLASLLLRLQDHERHVISQELHDSTAQYLVSSQLSSMKLRHLVRDRCDALAALDDIDDSLQEALKELRTFTYLLHPAVLANDTFDVALHRYIQGYSRRSGLLVRLDVDGPVNALSSQLQLATLRIVQEALANVYRHASASYVRVRCKKVGAYLRVAVVDDGHGFGSGRIEVPRPGLGLPGMRMRVIQLGGIFSVRTSPKGTIVLARVPITADDLTEATPTIRQSSKDSRSLVA